jgi:hypothetical protein
MSTGAQTTGPSVPSLWREVCDKCGTRMELEGRGYGFERWACPILPPGGRDRPRSAGRRALPVISGPSLALVGAGIPLLTAR